MELLLLLLVIGMWFMLSKRITVLEQEVARLKGVPDKPKTVPIQKYLNPNPQSARAPLATPATQTTNQSDPLQDFLRTNTLLKLGAFLLLLGITWFVNYAFAENWIGPVGRITLGLLFGVVCIGIGEWRSKVSESQCTAFMVVGVITILLTTFAARSVYGFFTPATSLMLMLMSICVMAFSSIIRNVEKRAIVSLILASIVPFLTNSPTSSSLALLLYGFTIISGTIWVVSLTKWHSLTVISMCIYGLYSFISFDQFLKPDVELLAITATAYGILFYTSSLVTHLKTKLYDSSMAFTSLANALLLFLWYSEVLPDHLLSPALILVALVFFLGAYVIAQKTQSSPVIIEYSGVALFLLAITAGKELDGLALSLAYSMLIFVGMTILMLVKKDMKLSQLFGLLLFLVFFISYADKTSSYSWLKAGFDGVLFSWWLMSAQMLALGYMFYQKSKEDAKWEVSVPLTATYSIGGLYMGLLSLWHTLETLFQSIDTAHMFALFIMTGVSILLMVVAHKKQSRLLSNTGFSVVGLVVARLLLIEVWGMQLLQRVIVFVTIGALLMGASFLKSQKTQQQP